MLCKRTNPNSRVLSSSTHPIFSSAETVLRSSPAASLPHHTTANPIRSFVDRLCCDIPEKEIQRRYTCPWSPNVVKALTPALTAASHSSHDLRFNASLIPSIE
ncbi:unnamed protein product [Brassica oleracea]